MTSSQMKEVRAEASSLRNEAEQVNQRQETRTSQKHKTSSQGHPSVILVTGWPKAHTNLHPLLVFRLGDRNF
jgi:hypothetical protein